MGAVVLETRVVQFHRLMERQIGQSRRQPAQGGRGGTADKHRHHVGPAGERSADLVHDIIFVSRRDALPQDVEPARTDHRQDHGAPGQRLIDGLGEVLPRSDVLHVHEDPMNAEKRAETIRQPTGVRRSIVAPVADEDVVHAAAVLLSPGSARRRMDGLTFAGAVSAEHVRQRVVAFVAGVFVDRSG